uniref:Uncharacterized protein n=1 Tax=Ciona savignyi TaxID=51511 RepID=H2ZLS2_CIOSA
MSTEVVRFLEECSTGNLTKVKEFIENGVKPDSFCTTDNKSSILPKGASGLCVAALEGHIEIIDFLLNNGADVHFKCQQGETALFLAARNGHDQVVTRLLDAGALLVYTGGPGEKRILEHWEVFTQVLHNVYPKDINKAENAQYKVIAQHLVEHNQMSDRPSILYESMFCSLTVFANPIAVYSVGVYATLCPELASAVFTEENFVRALCRAYDVSRTFDFVHTVHKMVAISKHRQKELCISLVKLFKWGDLLRRLAEDLTRYHTSDAESVVQFQELCDCLFRTLDVFSSNLYVRIIILDQFRVL